MPSPIQLGRWGRGLARLFGIQGQVPLTLIEDVAPVMDIGTPDDFLMGELPWGADVSLAAVVGQFGFLALSNPATSAVIIRLHFISNNGAGGLVVGILPGATGPTQLARGRDSRVGVFGPAGASGSIGQVAAGSNAVQLLNTGVESSTRLGTTIPLTSEGGAHPIYVLTPGFRLVLEGLSVNTFVGCTLHWTETALGPQELTP